jgi:hypothetical protein
MALSDVIFKRQNGLGKLPTGLDYVSAMLFYSDTLPAGFTATDRVKKIFSIDDAESLGITNDHAGETKAPGGNVLITTPGAAGIVNTIKIGDAVLGSYTVVTSDTNDLVAAGLRAARWRARRARWPPPCAG